VVDDEEMVRRLAAHILVKAGFHVLKAHDGREAVVLLSAIDSGVQLILSDIAMPGMTGEQLAAIVTARWPTMPILLMSGQGGPHAGYAGPFLPKPFTPDTLLDAVAALLPSEARRVATSPAGPRGGHGP